MLDQLGLILIGAVLASIGWFIRRWITRSHIDEQATRLERALDLKERLQRNGITIGEAKVLVDSLFTGPTKIDDTSFLFSNDFSKLDSNHALGVQLDARLKTLDCEISEIFLKIGILTDDKDYFASLEAAQKAWSTFRDAEGMAAAEQMAGGTGRMVNSLATEVSHTEKRIEYLNELLESMKKLYG
jgi:hypothetical protein